MNIYYYYYLKPFIPRHLQIYIRRKIAQSKKRKFADTWPIHPEAGDWPEGWKGWPNGQNFHIYLSG